MALKPDQVTIRSYQVGFGDCFLLSYRYPDDERHVLIDFGSTGMPDGASSTQLVDVARDIATRCRGKLHAVVATHRHKDHIAGFATAKGGKGPGDVIKRLKPEVVVQPWTEDPALRRTATGPGRKPADPQRLRVAALAAMHEVAQDALVQGRRARHFAKPLKDQLAFLGEDNIANKSAVTNLMTMAPNVYVHCGARSGLERVLPGIKIHVLGPPTVDQTATIKKMRSRDPDEFWHLQAAALRFAGASGGPGPAAPLFPRHVRSQGSRFPIETRWLIHHARQLRGEQLLQIVRMLDQQMNNTSLILLFESRTSRGEKYLLFPGDAQLENWQYALSQSKYAALLESVDVYKVGHHGSLNATPKSLWALFKKRSSDRGKKGRLRSLLSTMGGKHGSEDSNTEVPRRSLVQALKRDSDLFSTQSLAPAELYRDTIVPL